ncbi:uncharacterized protein At4g00950 [Nicotiana tomentosiformis]|uniref:Uncharacterized protein At4g00950-like isoform X2 n=1 Tax=Nicotiana tabacum TaxID=4097 RepID=A0A1S3ZTW3_TOBAC|nr:uncharacterized protein At4g00950 isoform X2 [Nicotiana tomentosiformis]XP_016467807.1 PREDICTED: uncharacterized protein At4g00950-like isoform X2 [Nicotiana tabacum]
MGSEEPSSRVPKLLEFSVPAKQSQKHKEMPNSPLHTLASVPFQWEQEPGKPNLPNSTFNIKPKFLEPPPRLYLDSIKTPSPNTVFDGPYNININKPKFSSSSFRFLKNNLQGNWWQKINVKRKGNTADDSTSSSVFLCSIDSTDSGNGNCDNKGRSSSARMASFRKNGSLSNLSSRSHIWAAIYEGFKQVIPRKNSKSKKEVHFS